MKVLQSLGTCAAALIVVGAMPGAHAAPLTLFATGVDAVGTPLPGGTLDPHWTIVSGPGVTVPRAATVLGNQHPNGNYVQTADSKWISTTVSGFGTSNTTFEYELLFDLGGHDPQTAGISGRWGVDNLGSVWLNGAPAQGLGVLTLSGDDWQNFNTLHEFSITAGFVPGMNSLRFAVSDVQNPSGLHVSGLVGSADLRSLPESPTLALSLAALGLLAAATRRRAPARRV